MSKVIRAASCLSVIEIILRAVMCRKDWRQKKQTRLGDQDATKTKPHVPPSLCAGDRSRLFSWTLLMRRESVSHTQSHFKARFTHSMYSRVNQKLKPAKELRVRIKDLKSANAAGFLPIPINRFSFTRRHGFDSRTGRLQLKFYIRIKNATSCQPQNYARETLHDLAWSCE